MKTKLLIMGVMLSAVLVTMNHLTFGQNDDIPPVPVKAEKATKSTATARAMDKDEDLVVSTQADLEGIQEGEEDLITISLDNAPLSDVVRMFSRISGANIVAGTNLQGTVTVSMHDVPWEPALRAILDSVDLVLVEKTESIYSIVSKGDLAAEPVTLETMFLEYSSVSNVLPVVQRMMVSTNSSVSAFPSANALVVQETAQRLNEIRQTVKQIDRPRAQVYIETKFIELNDSAIEDLGLDWQVLQSYGIGVNNIGGGYLRTKERSVTNRASVVRSRALDVDNIVDNRRNRTASDDITRNSSTRNQLFDVSGSFGTPGTGDFRSAAATGNNSFPTFESELNPGVFREGPSGEEIVVFPPFVEETVSFGNLLPSSDTSSATDFTSNDERRTELRDLTQNRATDAFASLVGLVDTDEINQFYGATLSAQDLQVTLSALKQNDGVDIVSNPKVVVANGETATIHVGVNEPNITAKPQGDTGDRFAVQLDPDNPFIETGVKVDVTPTVNNKDNIGVKIVPELSRIIGEKEAGLTSYPIISIRRIQTEFQLPSGRTVAIGGLTETSDTENINKVPLLGDIPVIGKYLFTHKHMEQSQDEVVIFVTVGLAESKDLVEVSGIPEEGELIHRHLANKALDEAARNKEE